MALEALEAYADWDSESEAAEATRRIRKPTSQSSFKPRPSPNTPQYATQAQLAASIARVDGKVKIVSDGMSTLNSRITALSTSIKREAEERKKTGDTQNKDLNQKMQMLALLPMLIPQKTAKLDSTTPLLDKNKNPITKIAVADPNSQMDSLLPLLMMTGMGGTGGGLGFGGDGSSGSDGSMMMLALVLAMSNK